MTYARHGSCAGNGASSMQIFLVSTHVKTSHRMHRFERSDFSFGKAWRPIFTSDQLSEGGKGGCGTTLGHLNGYTHHPFACRRDDPARFFGLTDVF